MRTANVNWLVYCLLIYIDCLYHDQNRIHFLSSENNIYSTCCETVHMSCMYNTKSVGHDMDPCGSGETHNII